MSLRPERARFDLGENITIDLFGKKLKFMADENVIDAGKVVDLLAQEVKKVQDMKTVSQEMDSFTKLTQAALNISNDFIELQNSYQDLLHVVMTRSDHLIKTIETGK